MPKFVFTRFAELFNRFTKKFKIALSLDLVSPADAIDILEKNPALLRKHEGLSQQMFGDADDAAILDGKGRPFFQTLVQRIQEDKWRWYFGIIARTNIGAVLDGITRLISIAKAGIPCWVLFYNDAKPEDFYMYDDEASARIAKDVLKGYGLPDAMAAVLAVVAPKAAGATNEDGTYKRVSRDTWFAYYKKNEKELTQAYEFVQTAKGEDPVIRQNLTAYMYFKHVSRKGTKDTEKAKRLLQIYKDGFGATNKVEAMMSDLRQTFKTHGAVLHERNQCMPLFVKVLRSAVAGKMVKYEVKSRTKKGRTTWFIDYPDEKKVKKAPNRTKYTDVTLQAGVEYEHVDLKAQGAKSGK
jgi:hypothetical protein